MNYYLRGLLGYPARLRHAMGFGIHSPFGFGFVTGVLRDLRHGYYAYPMVDEAARRHGRSKAEARALYRVLLGLCPACAEMPWPTPFSRDIAGLAMPAGAPAVAAESCDAPMSVMFVDCFAGDPALGARVALEHLSRQPSALLVTGLDRSAAARELWRLVRGGQPSAMVFDGWHSALAVSRRGLPAQCFPVLFPR